MKQGRRRVAGHPRSGSARLGRVPAHHRLAMVEGLMPPACPVVRDVGCYKASRSCPLSLAAEGSGEPGSDLESGEK